MNFKFETNANDVANFLEKYEERIIRNASIKSINDGLKEMVPDIKKSIAAETRVTASRLKNRVKIPKNGRAKVKMPYKGSVFVSMYPFEAYKNATAKQQGGTARRGVKWKGGAAPSGFVATMPSGKTSFFIRKGRARTPIDMIKIEMKPAAKKAGFVAALKQQPRHGKRMAENMVEIAKREIRKKGLDRGSR